MATFRPGKPCAVLSLAVAAAGGNGGAGIPFDTIEHEDPVGFVTNPAGPLTITVEGLYIVTMAAYRSSSSSSSVFNPYLERNGVNVSFMRQQISGTAGAVAGGISALLFLAVGDTVQAMTSNPVGIPQLAPDATRFGIARIGPKYWT